MRYEQMPMNREELRRMQLIQTDILKELDRVCRKNGISYILDGGTLLGAIRHKGFIPWDDDIDVRMLRRDYERFRQVADRELSGGVFYQDHCNDKGYPWLYSKLRMAGTRAVRLGQEKIPMRDGVFIDIFPCDGVPNDDTEYRKKCRKAKLIRKSLYARVARYTAESFIARLGWRMVALIPKAWIYGAADRLVSRLNSQDHDRVGCIGWHEEIDVKGLKKSWFTDLTEVEFEGGMYPAPRDWDGYLKYSYGDDYMTPPPEDKRGSTAPLSYFYLGEKEVKC
ncbi:MAG: LicD family protein [Lachnospiraceae bacterium]|nr:LicD family protein [Lachnospiraceae bacterium]